MEDWENKKENLVCNGISLKKMSWTSVPSPLKKIPVQLIFFLLAIKQSQIPYTPFLQALTFTGPLSAGLNILTGLENKLQLLV